MCVYACSEIDGEASILLVYHFETRTDKEMFYEYEIHRQVFFRKNGPQVGILLENVL